MLAVVFVKESTVLSTIESGFKPGTGSRSSAGLTRRGSEVDHAPVGKEGVCPLYGVLVENEEAIFSSAIGYSINPTTGRKGCAFVLNLKHVAPHATLTIGDSIINGWLRQCPMQGNEEGMLSQADAEGDFCEFQHWGSMGSGIIQEIVSLDSLSTEIKSIAYDYAIPTVTWEMDYNTFQYERKIYE